MLSKSNGFEVLNHYLRKIKLQKPRKNEDINFSPVQLSNLVHQFDTSCSLLILFPKLIPRNLDKINEIMKFYDDESDFWKFDKSINEKSHFAFQYELMIKPTVLGLSVINTFLSFFPEDCKSSLDNVEKLATRTTTHLIHWIKHSETFFSKHPTIDWWNVLLWMTRRFHISNTLTMPHSLRLKELILSLLREQMEDIVSRNKYSDVSLITLEEIHWRITEKFTCKFPEIIQEDPLLNILQLREIRAKWIQSPQLMFEDLLWLPYHQLSLPKSERKQLFQAIKTIVNRMNASSKNLEFNVALLISRLQQAKLSR